MNLAFPMVLYVSLPQMCSGMIGIAIWRTRSDGSSVVAIRVDASGHETAVTPASCMDGSRYPAPRDTSALIASTPSPHEKQASAEVAGSPSDHFIPSRMWKIQE